MFHATKSYTITPLCYRLQLGHLSNMYYKMPKFFFKYLKKLQLCSTKMPKGF